MAGARVAGGSTTAGTAGGGGDDGGVATGTTGETAGGFVRTGAASGGVRGGGSTTAVTAGEGEPGEGEATGSAISCAKLTTGTTGETADETLGECVGVAGDGDCGIVGGHGVGVDSDSIDKEDTKCGAPAGVTFKGPSSFMPSAVSGGDGMAGFSPNASAPADGGFCIGASRVKDSEGDGRGIVGTGDGLGEAALGGAVLSCGDSALAGVGVDG